MTFVGDQCMNAKVSRVIRGETESKSMSRRTWPCVQRKINVIVDPSLVYEEKMKVGTCMNARVSRVTSGKICISAQMTAC